MEVSNKSNTTLWVLLGLLIAAIYAVAVYKARPMLFPEISIKAAVDPACDLRVGPCVTQLKDGSLISFSIESRELQVVKPLQLQVSLQGMQAEKIEVDFSGVDMNMGFNRVKLNSGSAGEFTGSSMLPVCVWDAMEWEAQVLIDTQQGFFSVPYRFITVRPGVPLPGAE
ncbi:MAG: hypothetical protein KZQ66_16510 [Candidatus Thiodiazotropha sp. (ex Lucinoma aequizonata)]|nr:hypothetical protein [Candidatus Thiodiazotropha sp. (ex Lucinoma aequizonata)]MCU7888078.1 hypothetical protein [Candidatus Thiodiazotropha sp. (ex Lucinoma aequizonata)]MCU7896829.1 hypothetical protein [Candidatus Thiodiazotropha sp. (ex Lucinoma aequizonata)]MCU7899052.1 hypothetical protein [Candidatus Thiodiazotropha sp. (ex Lucinoma aequizonata)]MCU7903394.1 hypothetical protein [Candidatus Thiodiazotropha sp. (ex Lucinoma aequizonata)]